MGKVNSVHGHQELIAPGKCHSSWLVSLWPQNHTLPSSYQTPVLPSIVSGPQPQFLHPKSIAMSDWTYPAFWHSSLVRVKWDNKCQQSLNFWFVKYVLFNKFCLNMLYLSLFTILYIKTEKSQKYLTHLKLTIINHYMLIKTTHFMR